MISLYIDGKISLNIFILLYVNGLLKSVTYVIFYILLDKLK